MISLFDAVAGCIFDLATFNTHVPVKGSSCACAGGVTDTASHSRTISDASDVNFQVPIPDSQPVMSLLPPRLRKRQVGIRSALLGVDRAGQLPAVHTNLAFLRDHDDE